MDRPLCPKPADLIANDLKTPLASMQVTDRRLMFVCSANSSSTTIYYMRLFEHSPRTATKDIPAKESLFDVVPAARIPAKVQDGGNYLVLCVYGMDDGEPLSTDIERDLPEVLSKRLESLAL
jgi:hypothetical protein